MSQQAVRPPRLTIHVIDACVEAGDTAWAACLLDVRVETRAASQGMKLGDFLIDPDLQLARHTHDLCSISWPHDAASNPKVPTHG